MPPGALFFLRGTGRFGALSQLSGGVMRSGKHSGTAPRRLLLEAVETL